MALPSNKIKNVQTTDNTVYEIIPSRLQSNGYEAALPTLTANSIIALTSNTLQYAGEVTTNTLLSSLPLYCYFRLDGDFYFLKQEGFRSGTTSKTRITIWDDEKRYIYEVSGVPSNQTIGNAMSSSATLKTYMDLESGQTITGVKKFTSRPVMDGICTRDSYDGTNRIAATLNCYYDDDNFIGTAITAHGHFTAFGDDDNDDPRKPDDITESDDLDTDYFNTGITLRGDETYKISFPAKSGIFGLQVDIVDLTSVSTTSNNFNDGNAGPAE